MKKRKILMFAFVMLLSLFAFSSRVYAADVTCSALPDVVIDESIPKVVSIVILAIQIAVPVILVVMGSIDLVKGLAAQKEDEIKKGQQVLVKRLIAGALVFFVVAIVKLLISLVSADDNIMSCACYFLNGPDDTSCTE